MRQQTKFSIFALLLVSTISGSPAIAQHQDMLLVDGHNDLFIQYMDCKTCPRGLEAYDISEPTTGDTDKPTGKATASRGHLLLGAYSTAPAS